MTPTAFEGILVCFTIAAACVFLCPLFYWILTYRYSGSQIVKGTLPLKFPELKPIESSQVIAS